MKYAITLFLAIVINAGMQAGVKAQQIDRERMQQDLHIAENVLKEFFKTRWEAYGNTVKVYSGNLFSGKNEDINGTYLQDYGVIFTITGGGTAFVVQSNASGKTSDYNFQYINGDKKKVTKESIINHIEEFLRNYGPTIGQLPNNDRITVIYEANKPDDLTLFHYFQNGKSKSNQESLPSVYVSIKKKDLKAYTRGNINKKQFNSRLTVSEINKTNAKHQDVKIMAGILKNSFEDAENDEYSIREVNHSYVDNLGALFYVDASYGSNFGSLRIGTIIHNITKMIDIDSLSGKVIKPDSLMGKILHSKALKGHIVHPDSVISVWPKNNHKKQAKLRKEKIKAYQHFLYKLKKTIVDYGRTLRSVGSNERVYVSVSFLGSGDEVPSYFDLQIKKSILEALGTGKISRRHTMDKITVREY